MERERGGREGGRESGREGGRERERRRERKRGEREGGRESRREGGRERERVTTQVRHAPRDRLVFMSTVLDNILLPFGEKPQICNPHSVLIPLTGVNLQAKQRLISHSGVSSIR